MSLRPDRLKRDKDLAALLFKYGRSRRQHHQE
jgi:hypothetical protein